MASTFDEVSMYEINIAIEGLTINLGLSKYVLIAVIVLLFHANINRR